MSTSKPEPKILANFHKGGSISPFLGVGLIKGCDITETPGILKIANKLDSNPLKVNTDPSVTSLTVADVTVFDVLSGVEKKRRSFLTSGGQLITTNPLDDQEILVSGMGGGLDMITVNIVGTDGNTYRTLLYSTRIGKIGILVFTGSGVMWEHNLVTGLTTTHNIKLLKAQDGYIYFTNGNKIGRISIITFNTSTNALSATSTSNALDLPREDFAVTLVELGTNLLVGTTQSINWTTSVSNGANIYPWDRISPSFRMPVQVRESGINAMIQKDNVVYFSAGREGNIYVTDGVSYRLVRKIPYNSKNKYDGGCFVYPNAMCTTQEGTLLIGVSTLSTGAFKSSDRLGIWEIVLDQQTYPLHLKYPYKNGNTGGAYQILNFGYVRTLDHFGVATGTTFYIPSGGPYSPIYEHYVIESTKNDTQGFSPYTNYIASYESEMFIVGNRLNRRTFQNLSFLLAKPFVDGQGLKIYYRKNILEDFILLGEYNYSNIGAEISHEAIGSISEAEMVQFKVELSSTVPNNLELIKVEVW